MNESKVMPYTGPEAASMMRVVVEDILQQAKGTHETAHEFVSWHLPRIRSLITDIEAALASLGDVVAVGELQSLVDEWEGRKLRHNANSFDLGMHDEYLAVNARPSSQAGEVVGEVVTDRGSKYVALIDQSLPHGTKLYAALAHPRPVVPEGWEVTAAAWLREKAEQQRKTNAKYIDHADAYPTWKSFAIKFEMLADELLAAAPESGGV